MTAKTANLLKGTREELNNLNIGQAAVVKEPGDCNIVLYKIQDLNYCVELVLN